MISPRAIARWLLALLASTAGCGLFGDDDPDSISEPDEFRLREAVPTAPDDFGLALYQTVGERLSSGNEARLVTNGDVFDVIVQDIRAARSSVHVLVYIWAPGEVSERIVSAIEARRRERRIECRVLVDAFGSGEFEEEVQPALERAGCDVHVFRRDVADTLLERNHRKIVVVDGQVGLTGGFGIRDDWAGDGRTEGEWRDTGVRVRGPAVHGLQRAFAQSWIETTGTLLPASAFPTPATPGGVRAAVVTSSGGEISNAKRVMHLLFRRARERLWITNAYLVPSEEIEAVLAERAAAGVDVRVLTSGAKSDSNFAFASQQLDLPALEEKGVRTYEYRPAMMHAKTVVVDDTVSMVGSINLEPLSLENLEEVAVVAEDAGLTAELAAAFEADLEHAQRTSDD